MMVTRFTAAIALLLFFATGALGVTINEIRIDEPSTDNDEYVELAGNPGELLDGYWYIVIGDLSAAPRCGGIESVTSLSGMSIQADGLLAIGDSGTSGLHTFVYDVEANLNFENSDNVTHMIVFDFFGANGDDVDLDDDCVIDPGPPWLEIIDSVSLYEGTVIDCLGSDECIYSPTVVGPDGPYVPGHIYLCPEGWRIGDFTTGIDDTPGDPNDCSLPTPDPHATVPGHDPDGSFIWFGTGSVPPLPADFFGPGSDPFEGQIALDGEPLGPETWGDGSTLVQRFGEAVLPDDPPGTIGEIPIEIVALDLVSAEPIMVTYDGGLDPEFWNVQILLSDTPVPLGALNATKTHENGGVFETIFFVQPLFVFTRVADGMQEFLDTGSIGLPPLDFQALDGSWVHVVNPDLGVIAPSDGIFVPGIEELVPGDPLSQELRRLHADEPTGAARHTVIPARPIPPIPPPDPHASIPGSEPDGSFVGFGGPTVPPIPPDFFGPGSDPFFGDVSLEGNPIDQVQWGDGSTLAQRSADPFAQTDLPGTTPVTVEIEIVALDLVSIEPIIVTHNGGQDPEPWDVRVLLSATPAPVGQLTATKTHVNGGVFESTFFVQPLFEFTRVMDGMQMFLDTGDFGVPPLEFWALDGHWVHSVLPSLQVIAPSDGLFVPGVEEVIPGDINTQEIRRMHANEIAGMARHTVIPARRTGSGAEMMPELRFSMENFPNPFNPMTTIRFNLPGAERVQLTVYSVDGRRIATVLDEPREAGLHEVAWDGCDDQGRSVASGTYFCRLETDFSGETSKMVLVR